MKRSIQIKCLVGVVVLSASVGLADNYAVLFNGGSSPGENHFRYYNATLRMYNTLVHELHYLPENVTILASDGLNTGLDVNLNAAPPDQVTPNYDNSDWTSVDPASTVLSATPTHLTQTLGSLQTKMGTGDTFVLWVTDHGWGKDGNTSDLGEETISAWNGANVTVPSLIGDCLALQAQRQAYIFGQCFSGGFLEVMEDDAGMNIDDTPGLFGCASANHYETSLYHPISGNDFLSTLNDGIALGATRTHDFYTYAYNNAPFVTDGEGPDGTRTNLVQHPWKSGEDFDIAVAEWMGWQNGSWTDPDNWSDGIEAATDRPVRIRMDDTPNLPATLTGGSETIWDLAVWDTGELHIATGAALAVTVEVRNEGWIQITNADLDVTGAFKNLTAASELHMGNSATVTVGSLGNSGEVRVGLLSTLHSLSFASNDGTLTIHSGGTLRVDDKFTNSSGGQVIVEDAGSLLHVAGDFMADGLVDVHSAAGIAVSKSLQVGTGAKYGGGQVDIEHASLDVLNEMRIGVRHMGTVIASRSALEVGGKVIVGSSSNGTLSLRGSTLAAGSLLIGEDPGSEGDLILDESTGVPPEVEINGLAPRVVVGCEGTGTVTQNAGTLGGVGYNPDIPLRGGMKLIVGDAEGSVGVYNFNHGQINAWNALVGNNGTAMLIQRGGAADVYNVFGVGAGATAKGTCTFQGGSLTAVVGQIGSAGTGQVTQEEGLVTFTKMLDLAATATGRATYDLMGGTLRAHEIAGGAGASRINIDGGAMSLTGPAIKGLDDLYVGSAVGSAGAMTLNGKTLETYRLVVGGNGSGVVAVSSTDVKVDWLYVGLNESGSMTQMGGMAKVGKAWLGGNAGGTGEYRLEQGTMHTTGTTVGATGSGTFTQIGGAHDVDGELTVGHSGSGSSYSLSGPGAKLAADTEYIGHHATAHFTHNAGANGVKTDLYVGHGSGGQGTYELNGGVLAVDGGLYVAHDDGAGTLEINGGAMNVADLHVGMDTADGTAPGVLAIADPTAYVAVSNSLTIHESGTILAAPGSQIHMTGSAFGNTCTDPAMLAEMRRLSLVFEGGLTNVDPVEIAGEDRSADLAGFVDNFAVGTLRLGGADVGQVQLVDDIDNQPAWVGDESLYVVNLALGPGSRLDLNGKNLYFLNTVIHPTASIVNGTPIRVDIPGASAVIEGPASHPVEVVENPGGGYSSGANGMMGSPLAAALSYTYDVNVAELADAVAASPDGYVTLKMFYDEDELAVLEILEDTLRPYWWDGSQWVLGGTDTGGNTGASIFAGINVTIGDYGVGYCGLDTAGNFVWVNTTHASQYGLGGTTVPEPASLTLFLAGAPALLRRRSRLRETRRRRYRSLSTSRRSQ